MNFKKRSSVHRQNQEMAEERRNRRCRGGGGEEWGEKEGDRR